MPPTTNAVAAGTNASNATPRRGCRCEDMVSGFRLSRVLALAAGSRCVVAFFGCTTATIVLAVSTAYASASRAKLAERPSVLLVASVTLYRRSQLRPEEGETWVCTAASSEPSERGCPRLGTHLVQFRVARQEVRSFKLGGYSVRVGGFYLLVVFPKEVRLQVGQIAEK